MSTTFFHKAQQRASLANEQSGRARRFYDQFHSLDQRVNNWERIMTNDPVLLSTLLFALSIPIEIWLSFEMYRVFLENFTTTPHRLMVWGMGIFIAFSAAVASHLLSTSFSAGLSKWEMFNANTFPKVLEVEIEEKYSVRRKIKFYTGIFLSILILTLVACISWYRGYLMHLINNENTSTLIDKLFPVFVVAIEIGTGIYIFFIGTLLWVKIQRFITSYNFKNAQNMAINHTNMAFILIRQAQEENEAIEMTKDISDVMFRVTYRTPSADNYKDEIALNHCKVILKCGKQPIQHVRVIGFIENSNCTSATFTDGNGEVTLAWFQNAPLRAIDVNGILFSGPFFGDTTHQIHLDDFKNVYN